MIHRLTPRSHDSERPKNASSIVASSSHSKWRFCECLSLGTYLLLQRCAVFVRQVIAE